jgi:hypothetical protein
MRKIGLLFTLGGFALLGVKPWCAAAPGDLYALLPTDGVISKFSPDATKTNFASGLDQPSSIAFDRSADLFVSQPAQRNILKFTPSGDMTVFASELGGPGGMALDGIGNLYVAEIVGSDLGYLTKITPDGAKSKFGSCQGLLEWGWPAHLAFSNLGNLYVSAGGPNNYNGGIVVFSPDGTGHNSRVQSGLVFAFDTGGNLYVADADAVLKYALFASDSSVFVSGFTSINAMAFDSTGTLFVADALADHTSSIQKVSPNGTKTLFVSGLSAVGFLAFEPVTEKLRNISARGLVGTGDDILIGGFIVGGNALANNAVVLRAIGPSLSQASVKNPLADPTLELHNSGGTLIASNDNWQDTQKDKIMVTGLAPTDPNESAISATLPAGNYTAVVRGAGDTTGTALVEVYSINQ